MQKIANSVSVAPCEEFVEAAAGKSIFDAMQAIRQAALTCQCWHLTTRRWL